MPFRLTGQPGVGGGAGAITKLSEWNPAQSFRSPGRHLSVHPGRAAEETRP